MIRHLLALVLLALASCQPCHAGYTVVVRDQVSPKYITVMRPDGLKTVDNPGPVPSYPPTVQRLIYRPSDFDLYSADPVKRSELWEDGYGIDNDLAKVPGLAASLLQVARTSTSTALAATDYKVIKQAEGVYTLTAEEKAERQALRDKFNAYEAAVNAATTIEQLLAITWP